MAQGTLAFGDLSSIEEQFLIVFYDYTDAKTNKFISCI